MKHSCLKFLPFVIQEYWAFIGLPKPNEEKLVKKKKQESAISFIWKKLN